MKATLATKTLGVIAVLVIGIWLGGHASDLPGFVRNALVSNPGDAVISEALGDIQRDYFHPIGRGGLIDGSIAGAVASLRDPYAQYETPAGYSAFDHPKPYRFSGVGIVPVKTPHSGLLVQSVLPDTPAARAGIRAGDLITAVDGHSLAGVGDKAATSLIQGHPGTSVTLTVTRGSRRLMIKLTRELISTAQQIVAASVLTYHGLKLGYIELPTFDVPGIHAQFAGDLRSLLAVHVKGIVLDLRDNGGGLVTEAQLIASLFISHGVIVTTRGRDQPSEAIDATGHPLAPSLPMAVLVNGHTASAAEIVSGALQDHRRAVIVGTRTYGKGVFQELRPLSNGGALDITVGEYFLPNGENLGAGGLRRGAGIKPDVVVKAAPGARPDAQLQAALAVLAAKAH